VSTWTPLYLSPAFERLWGIDMDEILRHPDALARVVHPEDAAQLEMLLQTGESFNLEHRIIRPDGEVRWISARGVSVEVDDGSLRLAGISEDITERKAAQEELAQMRAEFESTLRFAGEALYRLDRDMRVTYMNDACLRMLNFEEHEVIGRPSHSLFHSDPKLPPNESCLVQTALLQGEVRNVELDHLYRSDGTRFPVSYIVAPVREQGEVVGVVCTVRDLTSQIKAEEQREQLEARLRQAERLEAIGQLSGGVAHDFNNILSVILNYAELIEESENADDSLKQDAAEIRNAAERAAALTKQLLLFSSPHVEEGDTADIGEVIQETVRLLRRTIGEQVEMHVALDPTQLLVPLSPAFVQQIVMNLVINARDAMPRGGNILIQTFGAGTKVRFSVSDTGCGMTNEVLQHAFDPFFTTKAKDQGTGLGLATVYGIVHNAGGDVSILSEPEVGTTVKVELPLVNAADVSTGTSSEKSASGRPRRVLVVEDEEALRNLICRLLREGGFEAVPASGGAVAKQILATAGESIDLVLTDVVMPEMSGKELSMHVREQFPELVVIFMSGYAEDVIAEHGSLGGVLLNKPFTRTRLIEAIREGMDGAAA
jgi:two-component system, cell cycle sensor histidine kinase and response regulator CckA